VPRSPFLITFDEEPHFDMVIKYSEGHLPSAPLEKFDRKSAAIIVSAATVDYF